MLLDYTTPLGLFVFHTVPSLRILHMKHVVSNETLMALQEMENAFESDIHYPLTG
jgi:hypothetical protein